MKTNKTEKPTHTPGPWEVRYDNPPCIYGRDGLDIVAQCDSAGEMARNQESANARLIAASPDLLNVCRMAAENIEEGYPHDASVILENLRAAIAKAEGR